MALILLTSVSTVKELGEMCYYSRQCKCMNQYSICSNENKCECQRGYIKQNNLCMPGKVLWNKTVHTEYSKGCLWVFF